MNVVKKIVGSKFCCMLAGCCWFTFTGLAQPTRVPVRMLKEYYFTPEITLKQGLNFMVITDRKQFNKTFGVTKRPDTPDFSKEWMLIMALPPLKKETKMIFEEVSWKAGNFIEVYYSVKKNLFPLTYTVYPMAVGIIPKYKGISLVNFYEQKTMRMTEKIEIK